MNSEILNDSLSPKPQKTINKIFKFLSANYLLFCFLMPLIFMLALYVLAVRLHPFGDGAVLVLDMNGQYVYYFEAFREAIVGDGSLIYNFSRALGGEFLGIYFYYLASPLSFIVLLFPKEMILDALITMVLIKTGLCGLTFGFYLHKRTAIKNKLSILLFSLLYALSSYSIVYQSNTMWIDAMIWLPIITFAIEELVRKKRFLLYVVSLTITIVSNFYIGYMVCIYSAMYFVYYCLSHKYEDLNPTGEDKHLLRSFLRFALYSILSAAICAFALIAAYYSLSFGKTDFSTPNFSFDLGFNIIKMLTKFLPGTYDTVRPQGLPLIYCGIISLFLLPIYFISKRILLRERIASAVFVLVFILSFWIKPFDLIWHGFQKPNWLNYRYSFMLVFLLLIMAYKAYTLLSRKHGRCLIVTGIFVLAFILIARNFELDSFITTDSALLETETVLVSLISATSIFVLLFALAIFKAKRIKQAAEILLAVVVCGELICNGWVLMRQFNKDVLYSKYSNYNSYIQTLRPVVDVIEEYDQGFYRTEKTEHRKYNDNLALGIFGVSNSTSTLNADGVNLLTDMGYVGRSHYTHHKGENPVGSSLLGIKYLISKKSASKISASSVLAQRYEQIYADEKYEVYKNPYALSLAYAVDKAIYDFDSDNFSTSFETLNAMVGEMLGRVETPQIFKEVSDFSVSTTRCSKSRTSRSTVYIPKDKENGGRVIFNMVADKAGEYYFQPRCEAATEVKMYVNNEYYGTYLGTKNSNMVCLGYFEFGESIQIELRITKSLYVLDDAPVLWYFDEEEYTSAFEELSQNPQFIIDEEFSQTKLTGTMATEEEGTTVLMTVPYDKGWKIYVDGERVETNEAMNSLLGFEISSAGEHSIVMKYSPDIYKPGAAISFVAIVIFALTVYFIHLKLRREQKDMVLEDILWDVLPPENSETIPEADEPENPQIDAPDEAQQENNNGGN